MSAANGLEHGFSDAVLSAQTAFRAVLDAMARPGTTPIMTSDAGVPAGLAPAMATLALTLFDHDTPIWRDEALNSEAIAQWLRFHTGAPLTGDPAQAAFALIGNVAALTDIHRFSTGSADYPDRSTTFILQVETLTAGLPLVLSGPGIKETSELAPSPLPPDFIAMLDANHALFPRGCDFLFCAGEHIAALPRTTRVRPKGA
jgi:alpha-D-ribose 1-methylphosphonate 5-triphosphate synthase subunit PhnH